MEIDTSEIVGELLQVYPELTDWFMDLGLCGCGHDSGMNWTLERLAKEKNMDIAVLLVEVNKRIT